MSIASKGRCLGKKHSEETRRKISESNKGRVPSDETKKKLSLSKMGNNNPAKNKEVRKKISESLKKYNKEKNNGIQ